MNGENELPEAWIEVKLGDICTKPQYGWTTSAIRGKTGLKLLRTTDISKGQIDWDTVPLCKDEPENPEKYLLNSGDIVISRAGSVGLSYLIDKCPPAVFASYLIRFKVLRPISPNYIFLFLKSPAYWKAITEESVGIALQNVNASKIKNIILPLPPLAEQCRIVAAVETLLEPVNASRERLDRVPGLLKAFRQAVLAAACSGRLTEGWREEKNFEKSISQIEINQNDTIISPKIPATWQITQLSKLTDLTSGFAFKKSEYSQNGIRLLQIANVSFGKIIWDDLAYLPHNYLEKYPNLCLKPGDILMALNRPILGNNLKIGILKNSDTPAILYQRVGRFDVFNQDFKPYLYLFLNSPFFISNLQKDLQGVDQPFIRKPKLLNFWVPLPPLSEQHEIVRRVESLFALADNIEQRVAAAKERADRLTQAILAKAFRGELVPTEAELARKEGREYEPASVLLERIREEREAEDLKKKRSSRKRAARKSS